MTSEYRDRIQTDPSIYIESYQRKSLRRRPFRRRVVGVPVRRRDRQRSADLRPGVAAARRDSP